jgi:hypothetical protein
LNGLAGEALPAFFEPDDWKIRPAAGLYRSIFKRVWCAVV